MTEIIRDVEIKRITTTALDLHVFSSRAECLDRNRELCRKFGLGGADENHHSKIPSPEQCEIFGLHILKVDEDVAVFHTGLTR